MVESAAALFVANNIDDTNDVSKAITAPFFTLRRCKLPTRKLSLPVTLGQVFGQMAPILEDLAATLVEDQYDGVIALESVYHPTGGTFEEGSQESVGRLKEIFG